MRSENLTTRLPCPIKEVLAERAHDLGYPTVSAYILGLVRYDLLTQRKHACTAELARLSNSEQDKIDDEITRLFRSGEAVHGSWFEARLQEAAGTKIEDTKPVVQRLLKKIAE